MRSVIIAEDTTEAGNDAKTEKDFREKPEYLHLKPFLI